MKAKVVARMGLKFAAAAIAGFASLLSVTPARADVPGAELLKAITDLDHLARRSTEAPTPSPRLQLSQQGVTDDPSPQNMGNAWFGVAPSVTLVARDWASSTRLAGDRMGFVEEVRLASSTRMVVGRVRLSATRFTPFLQVGLGQWRVDRNYMPLLPHTIEVASQFGAGFELRLNRHWQVAAETTATTLLREDDHTSAVPQAMLWSTLVASRIEF
jgi:hypothetical protein